MTTDHGPGIRLVDCRTCGASISTVALVQAMQCPACEEILEPCPSCGAWYRPIVGLGAGAYCDGCGLDGAVIRELRAGDRTLPQIRADPDVPQFQPVRATGDSEARSYQTPAGGGA